MIIARLKQRAVSKRRGASKPFREERVDDVQQEPNPLRSTTRRRRSSRHRRRTAGGLGGFASLGFDPIRGPA